MKLSVILAAVLGLTVTNWCQCKKLEPIPNTDDGIDYHMDDLFTTIIPDSGSERLAPEVSELPTMCDTPGSGSGSGGSGINFREVLLENCTIDESLPPRPTLTDLETVSRRAFCYAACAEQFLGSLTSVTLANLNYPGFPLWRAVTRSFILDQSGNPNHDCLEGERADHNGCNVNCDNFSDALQRVLDCERGCLLRLSQPNLNDAVCSRDCRNDCQRNTETGCGGITFGGMCGSAEVYPCGLDCSRLHCGEGCRQGSQFVVQNPYFPDAVPTQPPVVTAVSGSTERYFIDLTSTPLPEMPFRLGYSTIVLKIEDLSVPCDPPEPVYILLDEGFQFNLGGYSCREVNISYAVAPAGSRMSPFSPPTTVRVGEIVRNTFPCQLDSFQFTVKPDPDRFRYHVIELSWNEPCRSEAIENYQVSATSANLFCGRLETVLVSSASNILTWS